MEPYLTLIKDFEIRKALTRFRYINHRLMIEKGRHMNPIIEVNKRICRVCQVVEDMSSIC